MPKPGWKTTEFWATATVTLIGLLNQAFGWQIDSAAYASIVASVAGYALSRAIAKKQHP